MFDADVARARLSHAGLESVVLGDPAYSVAPHLVTEPGFRLVVRDEVAAHARSILAEGGSEDPEADALDTAYFARRFADRPTWVRAMTWTVMLAVVGPIAFAALIQAGWMTRGMFP